jgi:hypothetical protein
MASTSGVQCPQCKKYFAPSVVDDHATACMLRAGRAATRSEPEAAAAVDATPAARPELAGFRGQTTGARAGAGAATPRASATLSGFPPSRQRTVPSLSPFEIPYASGGRPPLMPEDSYDGRCLAAIDRVLPFLEGMIGQLQTAGDTLPTVWSVTRPAFLEMAAKLRKTDPLLPLLETTIPATDCSFSSTYVSELTTWFSSLMDVKRSIMAKLREAAGDTTTSMSRYPQSAAFKTPGPAATGTRAPPTPFDSPPAAAVVPPPLSRPLGAVADRTIGPTLAYEYGQSVLVQFPSKTSRISVLVGHAATEADLRALRIDVTVTATASDDSVLLARLGQVDDERVFGADDAMSRFVARAAVAMRDEHLSPAATAQVVAALRTFTLPALDPFVYSPATFVGTVPSEPVSVDGLTAALQAYVDVLSALFGTAADLTLTDAFRTLIDQRAFRHWGQHHARIAPALPAGPQVLAFFNSSLAAWSDEATRILRQAYRYAVVADNGTRGFSNVPLPAFTDFFPTRPSAAHMHQAVIMTQWAVAGLAPAPPAASTAPRGGGRGGRVTAAPTAPARPRAPAQPLEQPPGSTIDISTGPWPAWLTETVKAVPQSVDMVDARSAMRKERRLGQLEADNKAVCIRFLLFNTTPGTGCHNPACGRAHVTAPASL